METFLELNLRLRKVYMCERLKLMLRSDQDRDNYFMTYALTEAKAALNAGEIPVGCVVVAGDKVIGLGRNSRHSSDSKLAHAEINAIRTIENFLVDHRGTCEMFVTLEPFFWQEQLDWGSLVSIIWSSRRKR
jgi:deoxycytidylate deaminase